MTDTPPETVDDFTTVAELYATYARRLEQIVRLDVRAPECVVEDACQFAWSRLLHRRRHVRRATVRAWLATVAVHEAFKLLRRDDREHSLDAIMDGSAELSIRSWAAGPVELAEQRERLATLALLPERQQRFLWLRALGLSYDEVAAYSSCTPRTVERQLLNARTTLRLAEAG
jgi:RNA polymerase sigma factor (sigma-70 family)